MKKIKLNIEGVTTDAIELLPENNNCESVIYAHNKLMLVKRLINENNPDLNRTFIIKSLHAEIPECDRLLL